MALRNAKKAKLDSDMVGRGALVAAIPRWRFFVFHLDSKIGFVPIPDPDPMLGCLDHPCSDRR